VVLFVLLRSVVLPAKALIMNTLSIVASFGALVWIFQQGNLSAVLGFQPLGFVETTQPVILFCVLFGLSMDYEVPAVADQRRRRVGDNTASSPRTRRTARDCQRRAHHGGVFAAFSARASRSEPGIGMSIAILIGCGNHPGAPRPATCVSWATGTVGAGPAGFPIGSAGPSRTGTGERSGRRPVARSRARAR
jgi:RND superfamily putative drug exporter